MVLLVDKYRPKSLGDLSLHPELSEQLRILVQRPIFPHLLFYGPSGAGKKTRVNAVLRALYGPGVERAKVDNRMIEFTTGKSSKKIEITVLASNYHIELNPSDAGNRDTNVIQELIKQVAESQAVPSFSAAASSAASSSSSSAAPAGEAKPNFRVIVLTEVDRLTKMAQQALRRTMEKYMSNCRLILLCESSSRVSGPLKSRCLSLRVAAPSEKEIVGVLTRVAAKEKLQLPVGLAEAIVQQSGRNLRRALLMLESSRVEQWQHFAKQSGQAENVDFRQLVRPADWEIFVDALARTIMEEQTPQRLLQVRGKLYELLCNCIPPEVILRSLTLALVKRLDDQLRHETVQWAAFYEHRMQIGSKPIFHLEAFVAKFMALYKRWVVAAFHM